MRGNYYDPVLIVNIRSSREDDLEMDQIFEDLTYGQNLLDVIRRKGTQDTQSLQPSPRSIHTSPHLSLRLFGKGGETSPLVHTSDGEDAKSRSDSEDEK